jgi:peptidoglycan glycosyltransferase
MQAPLRAVAIALLALLGLLAIVQAYWQVVAAPAFLGSAYDTHASLLSKVTRPGRLLSGDGQTLLWPVRRHGEWVYQYGWPEEFAHLTGYDSHTGLQGRLAAALFGQPPFADWRTRLLAPHPLGNDVKLTVQASVQEALYRALRDWQGCGLVVRVSDGALLAAVSVPSYDPLAVASSKADWEIAATDPNQPLLFRPLENVYPPYWGMAWVVAAAVLEAGVGADAGLECDGAWRAGRIVVRCPRSHGRLGLPEALLQQCHVALAQAAERLGVERFRAFVKRVHLLDNGHLYLPSRAGAMPDFFGWRWRENFIEASLGERETRLTPLAMARFFLSLARGGEVLQPYLLSEVCSPAGRVLVRGCARSLGQGLSRPVADQLASLLKQAARQLGAEGESSGAAWAGTAWWGAPRRQPNAGEAWFVGLGPWPQPRVLLLLVLEKAANENVAVEVGLPLLHYILGMSI